MKKISRRNFLKGAAVLGTAAAMTACGGSSSSTSTAASTSAAASTGAASAAEASGKLVIYSPNSDTQIDCTLTNGFMVKYPNIEVELQSMGTGDVLARIEAEKRTRRPISTGVPSTSTSTSSTPTCGSRMFRPTRPIWTRTTATTPTAT